MDPASVIGLVASIGTLVSATISVIEYLNTIKNAPKESRGFLHEVLSLVVILDTLRSKVRDTDPTAPWVKQVCLLAADEGPLDQFKIAIDQLEAKRKTGSKVQIFGRTIIWPLTKTEISEVLVKVERLKSTIEIALHHDQLSVQCNQPFLLQVGLNRYSSLSLASKTEIDRINQNALQIAEGILEIQIHNRSEF